MPLQPASPNQTAAPAPAPAPRRVADINAVMNGWIDRGPWYYWDTFTWNLASPVVALPSEVDFFTVPIGQLDVYTNTRKTKLQTNMTQSGQFPPPRCLVLQQIGIHIVSTDSLADINKWFNASYLEFRIDDKIFFEGFTYFFPDGFGYSGHQNPTGAAEFINNGLPAPQYTVRYGDYSKYIAPLQQFSMKFFFPGTPPSLAANFSLVTFLNGLTDRSVQ